MDPLSGYEPIVAAINSLTAAVEAQNIILQGCNTALHGQWRCCIEGRLQSDLLLEISMTHYKLPPDERWALYTRRKAELELE